MTEAISAIEKGIVMARAQHNIRREQALMRMLSDYKAAKNRSNEISARVADLHPQNASPFLTTWLSRLTRIERS